MKRAPKSPHPLAWRISAALLSVSLSSCSFWSSVPSVGEQTEKLAETLDKGAYKSIGRFEIQTSREVWRHDRTELETIVTSPSEAGSYPLIVYLPGLGEDAEAGRIWRENWAKAGYIVFSLQSVKIAKALQALESKPDDNDRSDDPDLPADDIDLELPEAEARLERWSDQRQRNTRIARNSELRYLGHEYFAASNLAERLQNLYWAYRQFKNRAAARQAPYVSADLGKVVLAGYELGAQTVSAVAGEAYGLPSLDNNGLEPVAIIVLSPAVDLATGNVRSRFQNLKLPMLAVTGTQDNDPYAISSAPARTSIWDYAPGGDKFLLQLQEAGHRVLAGSEMGGRFNRDRSAEHFGGLFGDDVGRTSNRRRSGTDTDGLLNAPFDRERKRPDLGYKHVAAILSVSTAFLDRQIKHDEFAQVWLESKVNPWLGKAGNLKAK